MMQGFRDDEQIARYFLLLILPTNYGFWRKVGSNGYVAEKVPRKLCAACQEVMIRKLKRK